LKATVIVPVKRFATAKQRLLDAVGPQGRAALVKAMLADVMAATCEAEQVERIIVVTGEGRAEKIALHRAQRTDMPIEVFRDPDDAGHREAATLGIIRAKALGAECVALLPGDCPLLDPSELDAALGRLTGEGVRVVPDRHGSGTNALLLCPPDAIAPGFGPDSRERHTERARRRELDVDVDEVPSLALDLDTPDDLAALAELLAAEPEQAPETAKAIAGLEPLARESPE
jgi:2-phospho-L-lactate/phosphoenolpyruvate guanylyltransferase